MPDTNYWLVKSEPETFSWDDLNKLPKKTTHWDGVRNFRAKNNLRAMKKGDRVFFYHSGEKEIVGVCEVVREAYPDASALDKNDPHFDADSSADDPTWFMVDLRAIEALPRPVTLAAVKKRRELAAMSLVRLSRLSVSPVTSAEWNVIQAMARDGE
jgi:predicted RNA-binding protein with PUA-like domain